MLYTGLKYFINGKKRSQILRQQGEESYFQKVGFYAGKKINSSAQINRRIREKLLSDQPFMVARYGYTEMFVMRTFAFRMVWNYKKAVQQLCLWSGFFPMKVFLGRKFVKVMREMGKETDILGVELEPFEDYFISYDMKKELMISSLGDLEPWKNPKEPWTEGLRGKRVLVIHPFTETIVSQYKKRKEIFPGTEILPEFHLLTLKAVQTIAGETDERFKDWFEALNYMYERAMKIEFDVAIIGCGAYGFPLAAMLKKAGKQVIHLGGAVQILFGIKGKRWDEQEKYDYVRAFYTEAWVYPAEKERPKEMQKVEEGCYW